MMADSRRNRELEVSEAVNSGPHALGRCSFIT